MDNIITAENNDFVLTVNGDLSSGLEQLIDGRLDTKWSKKDNTAVFQVFPLSPGERVKVVHITNALDNPEKDPVEMAFYREGELIHLEYGIKFTDRLQTYSFELPDYEPGELVIVMKNSDTDADPPLIQLAKMELDFEEVPGYENTEPECDCGDFCENETPGYPPEIDLFVLKDMYEGFSEIRDRVEDAVEALKQYIGELEEG